MPPPSQHHPGDKNPRQPSARSWRNRRGALTTDNWNKTLSTLCQPELGEHSTLLLSPYSLPLGITNCLNACKYMSFLKLTENGAFCEDCSDSMNGKLMAILLLSRNVKLYCKTLQLVVLFPAAHYFLSIL